MTGDCWANAATEALECNYLIRNNRRVTLSSQPLLDHLKLGADDKSMGGAPATALEFFLKIGTATIQNYPYTGVPCNPRGTALPYRAVAWGYVRSDEPASDGGTDQGGPALPRSAGCLRAGDSQVSRLPWRIVRGNHSCGDQSERLWHSVLLVGWDDSRGTHGAWKIKNSWGSPMGRARLYVDCSWQQPGGTRGGLGPCHEPLYRLGADFVAQVPDALPLVPGTTSPAAGQKLLSGGLSADKLLFAVPQEGPDKLLQFIDDLNIKNSPSSAEKASFEKRKERAIVEAADRILAAKASAIQAHGKPSSTKSLRSKCSIASATRSSRTAWIICPRNWKGPATPT